MAAQRSRGSSLWESRKKAYYRPQNTGHVSEQDQVLFHRTSTRRIGAETTKAHES